MAALKSFAFLALLAGSAPASASQPVDRWAAHIREASLRFQVPEDWIRRVMQAESGGLATRSGRPVVSRAGAIGLMQLMPGTWREMRALLGLGGDPHAPRDNILAGTAYLRAMYDRFGYPGLFAAYNAGPGRYSAFLSAGRPLPWETRAYVAAVAGAAFRSADRRAPHATAFALPQTSPPAHNGGKEAPRRTDGLFVELSSSATP